jgi:hypothetical protein
LHRITCPTSGIDGEDYGIVELHVRHCLPLTLRQQTAAHEVLQESMTHLRLHRRDGRPIDRGGGMEDSTSRGRGRERARLHAAWIPRQALKLCGDFNRALAELAAPRIPSPWNLFENVRIDANGNLTSKPHRIGVVRIDHRIENATSAAPSEISTGATIVGLSRKGGTPTQATARRYNGWVCFPNTPMEFSDAAGNEPMSLDKQWQAGEMRGKARCRPRPRGPE